MKMAANFSVLTLSITILAAFLCVQAQQCTENFKDTLSVDGRGKGKRNHIEIRLMPTMRFLCKGTITGFMVTGRDRNGNSDPKIQIWRENKAQCGFYYKPVNDIVANTDSCTTIESSGSVVISDCALTSSDQVTVLPGDFVGIELPQTSDDNLELYFTNNGPESYVFQEQPSSTITTLELSRRDRITMEQPQIKLDIIADQTCNNGRGNVTPDGSAKGAGFHVVTRLIPDLRFGCNGSITQFTAGGLVQTGQQVPKIQVWRVRPTQCGTYFKTVSDIPVDGSACNGGITTISAGVYHCILKAAFRVQVQPGDILGVELPPSSSDSFEMFFTNGGPRNYVFQNDLSSGNDVHLSSRSSEVQEQPQINIVVGTDLTTEITTTVIDRTTTSMLSTTTSGIDTTSAEVTTTPETTTASVDTTSAEVTTTPETTTAGVDTTSADIITTPKTTTSNVDTTSFDMTTSQTPTSNIDTTKTDMQTTSMKQEETTTDVSETTTQALEDPAQNAAISLPLQIVVPGAAVGFIVLVIVLIMASVIFKMWRKNRKAIVLANRIVRDNTYPLANPMFRGDSNVTAVMNDIDIYETPIDETLDYEDMDGKDLDLDSIAKAKPSKADFQTTSPVKENDYSSNPQITAPTIPAPTHYDSLAPRSHYDVLPPRGRNESIPSLTPHELEEDDIYWEPANDVNELYLQLSTNKYRDIKLSQIRITQVLGSGHFGEVSKGVWQSPMGAMDVAVKQLQSGASEEEKVKFLQEAAINGQFRHPNVVKLMGVVRGNGPTMIVLELLSNGDLLNFLIRQRPNPGKTVSVNIQQMLLRFCEQVASGMNYLSSKSFVHRDLAARNILVSDDRICKISDFGMSRDIEDENYYVSKGGKVPVKWTAPEALHYKKYSTASDVWSFGCIMYEIWSLGHKPFEKFSNNETLRMVDKGYLLPPPPGTSKEIYKIMIQCWKYDSSRRPKFSQLVEMLSRADFELFAWEEEDTYGMDSRVKMIGAPLEMAQNLYPELQRSYMK